MKKIFTILFFFVLHSGIAQNVTIEGTFKLVQDAQAGYVLKSDANGVATWSPPELSDRKEIFVTDFGAKGDGNTDDTNAFQSAIDSAAIQGGMVHIPVGDYKISQTLNVPAGVKLQGYGLGNSLKVTANSTTGSRLSFYGANQYAVTFLGDYVGCSNLSIVDKGGQALGGINFMANDQASGLGATFTDLFLLDFNNGTSLKLTASGVSGIAWSSFENIHIRNAKKGIHIEVADDGSFINLVTFRSVDIAGANFDYGILVEGPLSTTDWYSVSLQADCPTKGHLVLNTDGAVNIYGIQIASEATNCSDQTVLIELNESSRGSYISGSTGIGTINDYGSNYIDVQGESDIGLRPSGSNIFQNAAFKGLNDNVLPYWEFKPCTNCSEPDLVAVEPAEWTVDHNVLKVIVGAGEKVAFAPQDIFFTLTYENKECIFGAMVKTDAMDIVVTPVFQGCGGNGVFTSGSAHPNDGDWHYVGKTSELNSSNICRPYPQFIFDNLAGSSAATVYITTPSFVFNRGEKPTLEAATINSAGGIMTGTLSTSMLEIASPNDNNLQLKNAANLFQISGTNTINNINQSSDIFPQGTMITLLFENAGLQVTHDINRLKLLASSHYVSEAYSTLKLVSLGDGTWQEIDRNCANGCVPTLNKIAIDQTTDLLEQEEDLVLKQPADLIPSTTLINVYPNPTKYGIHIAFNQWEFGKKYQLRLTDSSGRILLKTALIDKTSWIDFQPLNIAAGRYQVHVFTDNESVYNNGIIVVEH